MRTTASTIAAGRSARARLARCTVDPRRLRERSDGFVATIGSWAFSDERYRTALWEPMKPRRSALRDALVAVDSRVLGHAISDNLSGPHRARRAAPSDASAAADLRVPGHALSAAEIGADEPKPTARCHRRADGREGCRRPAWSSRRRPRQDLGRAGTVWIPSECHHGSTVAFRCSSGCSRGAPSPHADHDAGTPDRRRRGRCAASWSARRASRPGSARHRTRR